MKGSTLKLLAINFSLWTLSGCLITLCLTQDSWILTAVLMVLYGVAMIFLLLKAVKRYAPQISRVNVTKGQRVLMFALFPASYILVHTVIPDGALPFAAVKAIEGFTITSIGFFVLKLGKGTDAEEGRG